MEFRLFNGTTHAGRIKAYVQFCLAMSAWAINCDSAADELNGRPRKKLGYRTPEELFDEFLDSVYAASCCGSIAQNGSQRLPS